MLMRPTDIVRFAESAEPGERASYGRGENPPAELVRAMRPFVEARVLLPVRKREGGGFLFMVQRGQSAPSGPMVARARRRERRVRKTATSMVFDLLVQAARRGLPCPTNREIALRCRLTGVEAARWRLGKLMRDGKICVSGGKGPRTVTIIAGPHAGKRTLPEAR